jgi:hypothetical protein
MSFIKNPAFPNRPVHGCRTPTLALLKFALGVEEKVNVYR